MTFRGPIYAVNYSAWFSYVLDWRGGWTQGLSPSAILSPLDQNAQPTTAYIPVDWRNGYALSLSLSTLYRQDKFYGAPGQSPPGSYATPPPIDWRNGFQFRDWFLLGQDRFYGSPGQSPPGSYATPPPIDWRNGYTLSLVNSTLNCPVGKSTFPPVHILDWRSGFTETLVLSTLVGQDRFYGQPGQSPPPSLPTVQPIDWRTSWTSMGLALLVTPGPKPFFQAFWPTPPPIDWRATWQQGLVTSTLIGQDTFYGQPGQSPPGSYATPTPIDWRAGWSQALAHLIQPAPLPFNRSSWPTPTPVDWRNGFFLDLLQGTLRGQDTFYGQPGQSPPGSYATPPPLDWRNGFQLRNWFLLAQDRFYGAPGQSPPGSFATPPPIDWRNGWTQNLALTYSMPVGARTAPPRHEIDWRNGFQAWYPLWLIGQDTFYGRPGQSPPGSYSTPFPIDWQNGFVFNRALLYAPPVFPVGDQSFATPPPIDWRNGWTQITLALNFPVLPRPVGKQYTATPFPVDWRNGWTFPATALLFPIPPPLLPPSPLSFVRDRWDRDEWGRFLPGAGMHSAIGSKNTDTPAPITDQNRPWKVDN